ncbi:MAG: glycoside hydrolase family 20 zincin-like fold domain-containing protein, partial [Candidatus Thorarchaeota archaeon]
MFFCLDNLISTKILEEKLYLIPRPKFLKVLSNTNFKVSEKTIITTDISRDYEFIFTNLSDHLLRNNYSTKLDVNFTSTNFENHDFEIFISEFKNNFPNINLGAILKDKNTINEGYALIIKSNRIMVHAEKLQGLFYGLQTLVQILNCSASKNATQELIILDFPPLQIRG